MSTATEQVDEKAKEAVTGTEDADKAAADTKATVKEATTAKPKKAAIEGC